MFCPKCGASLEDGARFCPACGSMIDAPEVETPAEPVYEEPVFEAPAAEPVTEAPAAEEGYTPAAEPAKKSSFLDKLPVSPKILGIAAGALVVVILLIVLLTSGGGAGGAYTYVTSQIVATENDETAYIVSPNGKVQTIEGDGSINTRVSANGKAGNANSSGALNLFNESSNKKITDDCSGYYSISQDGSTVVYTEEGDEGYDLYTYKGGKSVKIASDVSSSNICISPNGSAIGYTVKSDDGDVKGYVYDGKVNDLGKNKIAVAVSNGASYVYLKKDGALYVQKKYNEDSRVKLADDASYTYFNVDLTEVMVYDGEKTVYSVKGGEKQTAFKFDPSFIFPANTYRAYVGSYTYVYGVKTFIGTFAYNDSKLVRLNRDLSTTTVAKNISDANVQLSTDGKTVIFRKDEKVRKVNGNANDPEPVEIVDEVEGFAATADCKVIFYSQDGELFAIKSSGGKGTKVAEDFKDAALYNGTTFLYSDGDTLYSSNGGKGQKAASFDDDISGVYAQGKLVIVVLKDGTYLYSTNAKTFNVLYEG